MPSELDVLIALVALLYPFHLILLWVVWPRPRRARLPFAPTFPATTEATGLPKHVCAYRNEPTTVEAKGEGALQVFECTGCGARQFRVQDAAGFVTIA